MTHEHEEHDHDHDDDAQSIEAGVQSQIFLELRQQNLELLQIATKFAGFGGEHGPLKPGDLKQALRTVWDVYAEFHAWVDPEESEEDEAGEDDE